MPLPRYNGKVRRIVVLPVGVDVVDDLLGLEEAASRLLCVLPVEQICPLLAAALPAWLRLDADPLERPAHMLPGAAVNRRDFPCGLLLLHIEPPQVGNIRHQRERTSPVAAIDRAIFAAVLHLRCIGPQLKRLATSRAILSSDEFSRTHRSHLSTL